jgi:hypothetical protein
MSPAVAALLTVAAGFVVGVALMLLDFVFVGIVVALAAIPAGLVVWMTRQ